MIKKSFTNTLISWKELFGYDKKGENSETSLIN